MGDLTQTGGSQFKGLLMVEVLLYLNFKGRVKYIQPEILGKVRLLQAEKVVSMKT